MKIYSMIVVTERQSRTRLFVDIPTNHKLVIVFSIIRKATPCNKFKKICHKYEPKSYCIFTYKEMQTFNNMLMSSCYIFI